MVAASRQQLPTRICVACRERRPVDELVRLVALSDRVVPDLRRVLTGRGAHLCPSRGCLDRAVKRKSFKRALRAHVRVEPLELRAALAEAFASEVQRVEGASRIGRVDQERTTWFAKALREFTLGDPGAMNRGLASRGATPAPDDDAQWRSENA